MCYNLKIIYDLKSFLKSISVILSLNLLHSERPKLYTIVGFLTAIGLRVLVLRQKTGCL